jgi:hypothetical protein
MEKEKQPETYPSDRIDRHGFSDRYADSHCMV